MSPVSKASYGMRITEGTIHVLYLMSVHMEAQPWIPVQLDGFIQRIQEARLLAQLVDDSGGEIRERESPSHGHGAGTSAHSTCLYHHSLGRGPFSCFPLE